MNEFYIFEKAIRGLRGCFFQGTFLFGGFLRETSRKPRNPFWGSPPKTNTIQIDWAFEGLEPAMHSRSSGLSSAEQLGASSFDDSFGWFEEQAKRKPTLLSARLLGFLGFFFFLKLGGCKQQ